MVSSSVALVRIHSRLELERKKPKIVLSIVYASVVCHLFQPSYKDTVQYVSL